MPLPHDDSYEPTEEASRASLQARPFGAWFDDDDTLAPIDPEIPANQADDDGDDE